MFLNPVLFLDGHEIPPRFTHAAATLFRKTLLLRRGEGAKPGTKLRKLMANRIFRPATDANYEIPSAASANEKKNKEHIKFFWLAAAPERQP